MRLAATQSLSQNGTGLDVFEKTAERTQSPPSAKEAPWLSSTYHDGNDAIK